MVAVAAVVVLLVVLAGAGMFWAIWRGRPRRHEPFERPPTVSNSFLRYWTNALGGQDSQRRSTTDRRRPGSP